MILAPFIKPDSRIDPTTTNPTTTRRVRPYGALVLALICVGYAAFILGSADGR